MDLDRSFRIFSYAAVFCGFFSLWIAGTFGIFETVGFVVVMVAAWQIEGTRWQISERVGTTMLLLALPLFYLAWRFKELGDGAAIAEVLAKMIVVLSGIKLLQKKQDRDWIFLYMMAFFELLLAAGLSISASYFASLIVFLLVIVCTIIAFEIRKTSRAVGLRIGGAGKSLTIVRKISGKRLPAVAIVLLTLTGIVAIPVFFSLPRVGGAGLGTNQLGLKTSTGFSDNVRLGGIGSIQQNDEVVMRVRVENERLDPAEMYFWGIALDSFDNRSWSRSRGATVEPNQSGDRDFIQFEYPSARDRLTVQTVFLEPLDVGVLFAMPRVIAIQGNFPMLLRDRYGAISINKADQRISYRVLSDRSEPSPEMLRKDDIAYSAEMANYLTLPDDHDHNIDRLTEEVVSGANGRYEKALAVESYLRSQFRYSLDQRAGGERPLSDFLFNVREGHCEYFATAMAIMLRTQGIATRIVNGFHGGDYNSTADITVVRQRNAHSWVEVYFPGTNAWVKFDPTPYSAAAGSDGLLGSIQGYIEALETYWVEYFVAYDDQGQASLARSVRRGIHSYQVTGATVLTDLQEYLWNWWVEVRGDRGLESSVRTLGLTAGYLTGFAFLIALSVWIFRRLRPWISSLSFWSRLRRRGEPEVIGFYGQLLRTLAELGFVKSACETPLEFAYSTGIPEAVEITEKYNLVRFGERELTPADSEEVASLLDAVSKNSRSE